MGRTPLQGNKLELLSADLQCRILAGEAVSRYLMEKDLIVEGVPPGQEGRFWPLYNLSARVSAVDVQIIGRDTVGIRGAVEGKALYYSAEGPGEISFADEAFYQEVVVLGAVPGMEVSGHGRISYLGEEGPPLEAEGKLLYRIRIEIEVLLTVSDAQQLTVGVGAKNVPPEKMERRMVIFEELLKEAAFPLTLSSELEFPGEVVYLKVFSACLANFDWQRLRDKVQLQGNLVTHYYYNTGTESGFNEHKQFFKEELFFDGVEQGAQVALFPVVEHVTCELRGKRAHQRAHIDILLRTTRQAQQEVLLAVEGLEMHKEYLILPRAAGVAGESLEIVQRIPLPYSREIAAGSLRLRDLQAVVENDGIALSGILERYVYYLPEEKKPKMDLWEEETKESLLLSLKVEEPFRYHLHLPGTRAGDTAVIYMRAGKGEFAPAEGATLLTSHVVLEIKVRQVEEYAVTVPSRVPPETSLIVYAVRKGDTLLKIARNYGLKAEALAEANGLAEDEPLYFGQKLLVPLMFIKR